MKITFDVLQMAQNEWAGIVADVLFIKLSHLYSVPEEEGKEHFFLWSFPQFCKNWWNDCWLSIRLFHRWSEKKIEKNKQDKERKWTCKRRERENARMVLYAWEWVRGRNTGDELCESKMHSEITR